MKSLATSAILSIAALSSCSLAVVTMNISKNPAPGLKLSNRLMVSRKKIDSLLDHEVNDILSSNYIMNVKVGTPPQDIALVIDTGSSDVWVLDTSTSICVDKLPASSRLFCRTPFDHEKSTTFEVSHPDAFDITYADRTSARGDYFTDNIQLGGVTVKAQTMGIAYNSSLAPGLLGIGYATNEASLAQDPPFMYPSIIDSLLDQGKINTKVYSLYLDDLNAATGNLLFGGLDSDKYQGNLVSMPIIPEDLGFGTTLYTTFSVPMVSMAIRMSDRQTPTKLTGSSFSATVLLDSGTTLSYLPQGLYDAILNEIGGEEDPISGFAFVSCSVRDSNPGLNFNFEFGEKETIVIRVPGAELIYDMEPIFGTQTAEVSISDPCMLGFLAQEGEPYILGDNFLRSAYVVYDLKNNLIALGQTNFDSTTSSIIDIPAGATTIPVRSGVATKAVTAAQKTPTTTASGRIGTQLGDGSSALPTNDVENPDGSGNPDGSRNPEGSKNPAAVSRPLELGGLAVLGMSMAFALMGGGLFLTF